MSSSRKERFTRARLQSFVVLMSRYVGCCGDRGAAEQARLGSILDDTTKAFISISLVSGRRQQWALTVLPPHTHHLLDPSGLCTARLPAAVPGVDRAAGLL